MPLNGTNDQNNPAAASNAGGGGASSARTVSLPLLDPPTDRPRKLRTSRRSKWRAAVLIAVHVLIIAHVAHWLIAGSTISPVEPSESMQTLELGLVNAGFIFFSLAILSTLIFGRFFCGWGCHVVALQDLCSWMLAKVKIRPKPFRSRVLIFIPVGLAFYMFFWPTLKRTLLFPWLNSVPDDSVFSGIAGWLAGFIRPPAAWPVDGPAMHLVVDDFWQTFPGPLVAVPFLFICGFAIVYFMGAKGFCTYGCPYGGIFGPVDKLSPGRIVVDHDKCDGNAHCTATCSSNVRVHEEIARYGMVVNPGCMKCMDCVSVCPSNALSFKFTKPAIFKGKGIEPAHANAKRSGKRSLYDTTIGEDLALLGIFLFTLIATRGLYDLVPLLMAVGIAGIVTFLAWKAWQIVRLPNARFRGWQFKRQGALTRTGIAYLLGCGILTLALLHAAVLNASAWQGNRIYERLPFNPARLYTANPPAIDEALRESVPPAIEAYQRARPFWAGGLGLAANPATDLRLATMHTIAGDRASAIVALRRVLERQPRSEAVYLRLGNLLIDEQREGEAIATYTEALQRLPWSLTTMQDLTGLLFERGRGTEAEPIVSGALDRIPNQRKHDDERAGTLELLGHIAARRNDPALAMERYRAATEADPTRAQSFESLAGGLLNIERDPEAAIEMLERAAELEPENPSRWLRLMQLSGSVGGPAAGMATGERALEALAAARDERPRRGERWLNLARMQATLGRMEEAIATIDAARAADLPSPIPTPTLIEFANQLRRPDIARRWAEESP